MLNNSNRNFYHETVMPIEAVEGLHVKKLAKYIDATAGNGGHMLEILNGGGMVLGIDMDPTMIETTQERLQGKTNFKLVNGNFIEIERIAKRENWEPVEGILFDLGVSNIHLKDLERGFSFENPEAVLDMRIDPQSQAVKASDLLNLLREDQLKNLFEATMDPGAAKWLSGRVIFSRNKKAIATVGDMIEICKGLKTKPGINPATLPFLALRIAVNSELDNLKEALPKAFDLLTSGGRLVVISFHSKEDEIVKDFIKEKALEGKGQQITFKPVMAKQEEIEKNRRSRSAKMRIVQKI